MDSLKEKYTAPETEFEKEVACVFQEVLQVNKIGIKDNFFKLGGNSLKVIRSVSQLQLKGFIVEINDFYKYGTVEGLSKKIKRKKKDFKNKFQERKQKILEAMKPKYQEKEFLSKSLEVQWALQTVSEALQEVKERMSVTWIVDTDFNDTHLSYVPPTLGS